MAICGRKTGYTSEIFSKYVDIGIKRSVLQSLIPRSKRFVKYSKTCDLGGFK